LVDEKKNILRALLFLLHDRIKIFILTSALKLNLGIENIANPKFAMQEPNLPSDIKSSTIDV